MQQMQPGSATERLDGPSGWRLGDLANVLIVSLVATLAAKLPQFAPSISATWFYYTNGPLLLVLPAAISVGLARRSGEFPVTAILAVPLICLYQNMLSTLPFESRELVVLAKFHSIPVLAGLFALIYCGSTRPSAESRIRFVEFATNAVILTIVLLAGGVALTLLTLLLFEVAALHSLIPWYIEWLVAGGTIAAPVVASHLALADAARRSVVIARIANAFVPLLLLSLTVFLIGIAANADEALDELHFLSRCNAVLIAVSYVLLGRLGAASDNRRGGLGGYLTAALIVVALLIDLIAIRGIFANVYHLGISPERLIVSGTNLVLFGFLAGNLWIAISELRLRSSRDRRLRFVAAYLLTFTLWGAVAYIVIPVGSLIPRSGMNSFWHRLAAENGCLYAVGGAIEAIDMHSGKSRFDLVLSREEFNRPSANAYGRPDSATMDSGGRYLFAEWVNDGIEVIDLRRRQVVGWIGSTASKVVTPSPTPGQVYVSSFKQVLRFDVDVLESSHSTEIAAPVAAAAVGESLFVVSRGHHLVRDAARRSEDNGLYIVDFRTGSASHRRFPFSGVVALAAAHDGTAVFVADMNGGISRITAATTEVERNNPLPLRRVGRVQRIRVGRSGALILVLYEVPLDATHLGTFARIEDPWLPRRMRPAHKVVVMDAETLAVERVFDMPRKISDFVVSPRETRIFAARSDEGKIDVFSLASGRLLGTLTTTRNRAGASYLFADSQPCVHGVD